MVEKRNAATGIGAVALIAILIFFVLPAMGIELFPFGKARTVVNIHGDCLGVFCWYDAASTTVSINKFAIASIFPRELSVIEADRIARGLPPQTAVPAAIFMGCGWLGGGEYTTAKFSVTESGFLEEKAIHICQGDNVINFYFPLSTEINCYNWKLVVSDVTKTGKWCSG